MDLVHKTDEEIAAAAKQGDTESFGLLVERYEKKITRYGRKFLSNSEDIKDLVQDIFIKTYVNIQSFDTAKKFSSWIYRIAHNKFVNALKKKTRSPLLFFDFDLDVLWPHPTAPTRPDLELEKKNLAELMEKYLNRLSHKHREVLILYFFEELSYREISEILKIPVSTAGVRLSRAKAVLKKIYEREN